MSLKPRLRFFHTVKFKVALCYATLFTVAAAATFFSVYWTLSSIMTSKADKELMAFSHELECSFLRGSDGGAEDEWLPLDKIPPQVLSAVKLAVDGIKVHEAKIGGANEQKQTYEVFGILDSRSYTVKVSRAGELLAVESATLKERIQRLEDEFYDESYSEGLNRIYFLLLSPQGEILAKSDTSYWPELKHATSRPIPKLKGGVQFKTEPIRKRHRNARIIDKVLFDGNIIEVGQTTLEEEKVLNSYLSISLSILGGMLVLGSLAGWLIARKFMAGVDRVRKAAISIGQGDFSRRVSPGGEGEEIDNLVFAFNEMIARTQTLIMELKSVSDNIAHDLRTPLTRIRGTIEVALAGNPDAEELKELSCGVVEDCDRLLLMINTMLEITQTESGLMEIDRQHFDLKALVSMAYELFLPLAEEKKIEFKTKLPEEDLKIHGDKVRLQRVVSNLLDNAIKYTPEKGRIEISAGCDTQCAWIAVKDGGCGIPEAEQARVFERFYRGDSSRSQPGNGLGLSLVHAIVKAHNGVVTVESLPGKGSLFTVKLPQDRESDQDVKEASQDLRNPKGPPPIQ